MSAERILVVFRTGEGHTRKVAEHIADRMRAAGATVDVVDAVDAPAPSAGYAGAVLGDSIHRGRHSKELTAYAKQHSAELQAMPSALFQVSLVSMSQDPKNLEHAQALFDKLPKASGWTPEVTGMFAGALKYTQYGWFTRQLMKKIVRRQGGDTDTTRDYEYTDWAIVDGFADEVFTHVRAGLD